jgi:hypothetical protein
LARAAGAQPALTVQVAPRDAAQTAQRLREEQRRLRGRVALLLARRQAVGEAHELPHELHELDHVVRVELARAHSGLS